MVFDILDLLTIHAYANVYTNEVQLFILVSFIMLIFKVQFIWCNLSNGATYDDVQLSLP